MNKLQTEVVHLQRYEHSERDREILEGIAHYGSVPKLVKHSEFKKRTVHRRLAAMRKNAERFGFSQEFPDSSLVTDMPAYGRSFYQSFEEPRADGVKGIWHKVKSEDVTLAQMISSMVEGLNITPTKPRKVKGTASEDLLPVLTMADVHLGMLTAKGESGIEWNMQKGIEANKFAIDYLVDKMHRVKHAVFVNLGDFTHADGLRAETPRSKNMLDVSHRYIDVSRAAGELLRYAIDRLLEKADTVKVFNIRGNHDDITCWHLNQHLMAIYMNEPRVNIEDNDAYTQAYTWKNNLLCMTHGEAVKFQTFYNTITTEFDKKFGQAQYCYAMQGHTHHPVSDNIGKIFFETHSTLAVKDAYHVLKQYQSLRRMNLVNLDPDGGEHSRVIYNPKLLPS